jgi:hypothetical protein
MRGLRRHLGRDRESGGQNMTDSLTEKELSTEQAIQAVLDRGNVVWVVFGVYSDRSGSKLLGVYTDQWAAEDRVKMLKEAGAVYSVNYARMPLNKTFGVELNP